MKKRKAQELPCHRSSNTNSNRVPRLIGNKCNYIEPQIGAEERDRLLINEATEEAIIV